VACFMASIWRNGHIMAVVRWDDRPSTCASAVSAGCSQKVISMARYSSMAVESSARACSVGRS
jgi:hypothetical protein